MIMELNIPTHSEPQIPIQPIVLPVQPTTEHIQAPAEQNFEPTKKSLPKWPLIIAGVILLATLLTGTYLLGKNQGINQKQAIITPAPTQAVTVSIPTAAPANNDTTTWKTYSSALSGYSVKIPSDWQTDQFNNNPIDKTKNPTSTESFPPGVSAIPEDSFGVGPLSYYDVNGNIYKTIPSLGEIKAPWEEHNYADSWFLERTTMPTKINGHNAIVKKAVWATTAPKNFTGESSDQINVTDKVIYIDLGNEKYLVVSEQWQNSKPELEKQLDQISATLTLTQ